MHSTLLPLPIHKPSRLLTTLNTPPFPHTTPKPAPLYHPSTNFPLSTPQFALKPSSSNTPLSATPFPLQIHLLKSKPSTSSPAFPLHQYNQPAPTNTLKHSFLTTHHPHLHNAHTFSTPMPHILPLPRTLTHRAPTTCPPTPHRSPRPFINPAQTSLPAHHTLNASPTSHPQILSPLDHP